jgi:hypothetical protein
LPVKVFSANVSNELTSVTDPLATPIDQTGVHGIQLRTAQQPVV